MIIHIFGKSIHVLYFIDALGLSTLLIIGAALIIHY
jgi:hypothetical protein